MQPLPPPTHRPEVLDFLSTRRSVPAKTLGGPGPEGSDLLTLIEMASRVPDHGKLVPWRFIVIGSDKQRAVGEAAMNRLRVLGHDQGAVDKIATVFSHGATIVTVVFSPHLASSIPSWEQELASGAVCLSLVNAALASGWGANWLTGALSRDRAFLKETLGCNIDEWVAGFIHIGTVRIPPAERPRPDIGKLTTWL